MRNKADIDREATDWVVRLGSDQRTGADETAFKAWLDADPAHANVFAEQQALWSGVAAMSEEDDAKAFLFRETPPQPVFTRRRMIIGGSAAAAAAGIAIVAPQFFGPSRYTTAKGEQRTIDLADGSVIALNTDSALTVDLTKAERQITLERGQAFFKVAKDRSRPFRVFAGTYEVRALGTAFDVHRVGDGAKVTLEEGSVAIFDGINPQALLSPHNPTAKPTIILKPDQQVVMARKAPIVVARIDPKSIAPWRYGQLVLDDAPLGDIVEDLNRYGGPQIVLADPSLANIRISGVFHTGRPDLLVEALTAGFPVRVAQQTPDRIVLAPR
jgi:transmembrane sensor